MTKPLNFILAVAFMLLSGRALAQKVVPTDKEIIDLYCNGKALEKGRFININGKTNLECDLGSDRYLFEKTNAKLGLSNKKAVKKKAYDVHPSKWSELTIDYLFEQAKGKCSKVEMVNGLPIFYCKPDNIIFSEVMFKTYQTRVKEMYNTGAESFANDPNQTELAPILIAKDKNSTVVEPVVVSQGALKDYFALPDLNSRFPGFEQLGKMDFATNTFNPRFWTTTPKVNADFTQPYKSGLVKLDANTARLANHALGVRALYPGTYAGYVKAVAAMEQTNAANPAAATEVTVEQTTAATTTVESKTVEQTPAATTTVETKTVEQTPAATTTVETKTVEQTPAATATVETETVEQTPTATTTPVEVKVVPASEGSCKDQLSQALTKLLEDDKQNIIGHQFELTVLKLASFAASDNKKSLEDLIRKKSSFIAQMDKGIIGQMNQVYKEYGLKADAEKITTHLKRKAVNASYFPRDKRFFNEDTSAFVLAFQKMTPNSGVKDTDVSVLWFMDKISKEVRKTQGKYSAAANLTNLSTRIAQYTGLTGAKKAYSHDELKALAANQQKELNAELNGFIDSFKQANAACYKELFTDSKADCDLSVVEGSLAQILAVQSQIPSADLVNIEGQEKLDKSRFQIVKFANED